MQMQAVMMHVKDMKNLKCTTLDINNRMLANQHFVIDFVTSTCNQQANIFTTELDNLNNRLNENYDFKSNTNEIDILPNDNGYYQRMNQQPNLINEQYNRNLSSVFVEHLPVFLLIVVVSVFVIFAILLCIFRNDICVWAYSSFGIRLFQRTSNLGYPRHVERLYDAFVSFTNQEKDFVNTMVNTLEHGQPSYRLSINYRDVPVTNYEKEAIQKFIECSHRTIIVLSPQYIRSENCMYELKVAFHHSIETKGAHQLIIIEMDKQLNPNDYYLYDDLGAALSSPYTTRISFDEKRFWDKLKFCLPNARAQSSFDYRNSTLTMNSTTFNTNTNIYNNKFNSSINTLRNYGPYNTPICDYKRGLPTNV